MTLVEVAMLFKWSRGFSEFLYVKLIYSEKATKFCEISTVDLSYVAPVKSTVQISQNFVAFSEYLYTTTYKSMLTQKKWHKKSNAISSIYGKNGIIPWYFFLILT